MVVGGRAVDIAAVVKFLSALGATATEPLALIGYVALLIVYWLAYRRTARMKELLGSIEKVPESERAALVKSELGEPVPPTLNPRQWLLYKKRNQLFLSVLVTLGAAGAILFITVYNYTSPPKSEFTSSCNVSGTCNFAFCGVNIVQSHRTEIVNKCADPSAVYEEYARLFGMSAVPALMAIQEARGHVNKDGVVNRVVLSREVFPISNEVLDFWNNEWPYKSASALTNTPLWRLYAGNNKAWPYTRVVLYLGEKIHLACFLGVVEEYSPADTGSVVTETQFYQQAVAAKKLDYEKCQPYTDIKDNFGFTFFTIKNDTGGAISNIAIEYRVVPLKNGGVRRALKQFAGANDYNDFDKVLVNRGRLQAMLANNDSTPDIANLVFDKPDNPDSSEAKTTDIKRMIIGTLSSEESVITLINTFIPNSDGLPAYYLDDAIVPETISYKIGENSITRKLRQPAGELAARKGLSWGWYSQ